MKDMMLFLFMSGLLFIYFSVFSGESTKYRMENHNPTNANYSSTFSPKNNAIIIKTTWRSGSTFLYNIFDSHPDLFLHYEPLLPFGIRTFYEKSKHTNFYQSIVTSLLKCRYDKNYMAKIWRGIFTLLRNKKITKFCRFKTRAVNLNHCYKKTILEEICKSYKWTGMKLIRLGMKFLMPILEDNTLNTYIIFLVRDPRAVMKSRMTSVSFCETSRDCYDPRKLCSDMEDDLKAYTELSKLFPGRLIFLRYEDLCMDPNGILEQIFHSIKLDYHPKIKYYIDTHTTRENWPPGGTYRISKKKVLDWTTQINRKQLHQIQNACFTVMEKLGYKLIYTLSNNSINDVLEDLKL
ncbi:UNVERIFIED_CONTAM: hypothetical protein RMT77_008704 [Armadillidium vulgare]